MSLLPKNGRYLPTFPLSSAKDTSQLGGWHMDKLPCCRTPASLHDKLRVEESDLDAVLTIGTFADKLRELIFQTLGLHATSPAPALHQVRFYQQEPVQEPPVQSHRSSSPLTELSEHSERSSSPSTEICEVEERLPEQPPSPFHAFHEPTSKANRLVHSSLKRPAEIDETIQHKGKQRRTEFVPAAYVPSKPAQDFTPAQMVIQRKMAFEYVQKSIRDGHVVSLDYDLAVARFLQETSHLNLGDIPHAVDLVLAGSERQGLSTSLQSGAYQCAKYIKKTLLAYESDPQQGKPFALRYPNLHALRARAMTNIASMRAMPSDVPVILLDIAGRVLAIGLPPKRHDTPATKDSLVHPAENEVPIVAYIQNEASQPPNGNHQRVRDRQGWHTANHVYSYPQERALLACLGLARVYNLPIVDQELFDQAPKNRPTSLTPFPLTLKSGSQLSQSSSEVSTHIGSIYGSVQYQLIGYGLGVGSRRYPQINSADIADKKLAFGQAYKGARFVLSNLGVTLCGDHGYSVHGLFKVLVHSVTHILPDTNHTQPPQRISLAIYNHADAFAGIARYSAAKDQTGLFSNPSLWLPLSPGNFSVSDCVKSS
ncbi:uncharacterized protein MELLADRAFT_104448 [Melampsora larici-populina 98AG31]|uniref:Uncharacterized protein n=1 Tax=Melampsora larici-populina (strain 98AG31 / pathotype 3-4-7) TaxID=747676 RepID=F4REQ7_MELLP|nr:uncharacterized protein MELLADRAFT_104448 [Melampsora larici-populina 98AG31]EGG09236.1 hypothetical protein MELLADRAFT_104448 [Melampsora larici-populina 98AG31]